MRLYVFTLLLPLVFLAIPAHGSHIGLHVGPGDSFVFDAFLFAGPVTTTEDGKFAVAVGMKDEGSGDPMVWLFDGLVLDAQDDLGRTFTATAATDPFFDAFVAVLTSGIVDRGSTCAGLPSAFPATGTGCMAASGGGFPFIAGIGDNPADFLVTDFIGTSINSISLTFDSIFHPIFETQIFNGTLSVFGTGVVGTGGGGPPGVIPELNAALLFGIGLLVVGATLRKARY